MTVSSVVVLVVTLIALGALARPLADRLRLPVSIILALGGSTLGFASLYTIAHPGSVMPVEVAEVLLNLPIGSSLFLYVLLPTLIFQSALNVDVHHVREDLPPIVVLALVAVVFATFGIAFALWPFAGMPLFACLVLASLVATTDPVAVIAIFKDVGAPERLTRLVEGESLFNDAAAISFFLLFTAALIDPASIDAMRVAKDLILLPLGGAVLGFVTALIFIDLMRMLRDDRLTAVSLSLALPYLSFWGAEELHVSGVISVAVAGVTLASLAPGRVPSGTWRHLCDTWEQLASWSAILIFVLTSLLVPRLLGKAELFHLVLLGIVFVAALGTRALVLIWLMPWVTRRSLTAEVSPAYRLVILWGGLRGSMTLALALAVTENPVVPEDVATFVATLATGFTLMTLFVQGTTLRPLIQWLKLDRLTGIDRALRDLALGVTATRVARFANEMIARFDRAEPIAASGDAAAEDALPREPGGEGLADEQRLTIALVALTAREREVVLDHFASGALSPRVARRLAGDARRRLDTVRLLGMQGYSEANGDEIGFDWLDRFAFALQRRFGTSRLLSRRLSERFEKLIETSMVIGKLAVYVDGQLRPFLGEETVVDATRALSERLASIEREIDAVELQYPAYVAKLEQAVIARSARALEAQAIGELKHSGVINSEVERDALLSIRQRDHDRLEVPELDLELDIRVLIDSCPLFRPLSEQDRAELAPLLKPFFSAPGMAIIRKGEVGDAAYFIASGAVEIDTGAGLHRLGRGDIFGEMALLFDMRRQADVNAIAYSALMRLSLADFQRFLSRHPLLRSGIEAIGRDRLAANAAVANVSEVA